MKETYLTPAVETVLFAAADVIATSGEAASDPFEGQVDNF